MTDLLAYLGLWLSAFTSASLLPGSSEVVMAALWYQHFSLVGLWVVATSGNWAGSCLNYWLGWQLPRFAGRRWFPVQAAELNRAQAWFQRYGQWALLFSWLPVVGDPLTLFAGVARLSWWRFTGLVLIAKGSRYAVLLIAADQLLTPWLES